MEEAPSHPPRAARWGPWRTLPPEGVESRKLKVLLLHGFCASPRELRPLGQALSRAGFRCLAPLLPGHGEQLSGMRSCLVEDWLEAVHLTFEALRRDGSTVAVVGYCLGGSLALSTAPELGPRGLIALAAPTFEFPRELFEQEQNAVYRTSRWVENCNSPAALRWRRLGSHPLTSENFVENYAMVAREAAERLSEIRCPVLVAEAGQSGVLKPGDAKRMLDKLSSAQSKVHFESPEAGHALLVDRGRSNLRARVVEFLKQLDQAEQKLSF